MPSKIDLDLFFYSFRLKMTNESGDNTVTVSAMSDMDILIQYYLENKVNKIAVDELLKQGFDSLDMLKLVNMEDLSSQHIPMGQRRLIFHIAQALNKADNTSVSANQSKWLTATPTSEGNTGVSQQLQNAGATSAGNTDQSAVSTMTKPLAGNTWVSQAYPGPQQQDVYSQTLFNTLLPQQTQLATLGHSNNHSSSESVNIQMQ